LIIILCTKMKYANGEELLLAVSPVFKRRYTHDGDFLLGCKLGCQFCYYRWISASKDFIGTGRLKRLCTPDQMAEFLKGSKLFLPRDILILGARGDASMYSEEVLEFLEIVEDDKFFDRNVVLILHRAPANETVLKCFDESENFRFGTTITPKAFSLGWTVVPEEVQMEKLKWLVGCGVPTSKISVEVGPLNSLNMEAGVETLRELEEIGFRDVVVRGAAFGSFGVDRERELRKMLEMKFISEEMLKSAKEDHEYYVVKNFLTPQAYSWLQDQVPSLTVHRYTYTFYSGVWEVPVARNRRNEVRVGGIVNHSVKTVRKVVEKYGLEVRSVDVETDHYFVELDGDQPATEDIAMTVGAELQEAVLFDKYRQTASLSDVAFYRENGLFYLDPYLPRVEG